MRNHPLPTIPAPKLAAVTGGCHKGQQPQAPQQSEGPDVQVSVATGQVGGQAIQQALSGGMAS